MKITSKSLLAAVLMWLGRSAKAQPIPPAGGGGGAAVWGDITGSLPDQTDLNTALGTKAPAASPALTGTPTAPTASPGTNTTQVATTAFVLSAGPAGSSGDLQKKSGSAFAASVINDTAGAVTVTVPASTAGPVVTCAAANSTSSGNGAAAQTGLDITAAAGQATTQNSGTATGGTGGGATITAGQGGASTHGVGGNGATVAITGGKGGDTSAALAGGTGGPVTILGGDGGATASGTQGTGGIVTIDGGSVGNGGSGGAGGQVRIGTGSAGSVAIGRSSKTTTINGNIALPNAIAEPYLTVGGSAYGPLSIITPPPLVSALTWVNQGGATASNVGAGNAILMFAPSNSGDSLRYLHTAAYPTPTFTFTIGMKLMCLNADFQIHGIAISDGTKYAAFGMGRNGSLGATGYTFATATSGGVTIGAIPFTSLLASPTWFVSLTDDGTTITIKQGPDPLNMMTIGSASRATLGLTPTQIGVFLDPNNTNFGAQCLFFHWAFS